MSLGARVCGSLFLPLLLGTGFLLSELMRTRWNVPLWLVPTSTEVLVVLLVLLPLERWFPRREAWNLSPSHGTKAMVSELALDLGYWAFVILLAPRLGELLTPMRVAGNLHEAAIAHGWAWPRAWSLPVRVLMAFLLSEFFGYWMHRAFHSTQVLWRFHRTHHHLTRLNVLKSFRAHPLDNVLIALPSTVALLAVGVDVPALVISGLLGSLLSDYAHTNVAVPDSFWSWFFVSPQHHAVHHSTNIAESKSNYGCRMLLWDRIFGTFRAGFVHPEQAIGVDPVRDLSLWEQLVHPLYKRTLDGI